MLSWPAPQEMWDLPVVRDTGVGVRLLFCQLFQFHAGCHKLGNTSSQTHSLGDNSSFDFIKLSGNLLHSQSPTHAFCCGSLGKKWLEIVTAFNAHASKRDFESSSEHFCYACSDSPKKWRSRQYPQKGFFNYNRSPLYLLHLLYLLLLISSRNIFDIIKKYVSLEELGT